jgi:hypothetical protein
MTIQEMEKLYNVKIKLDMIHDPLTDRITKRYKIITKDGNKWDNGLTWNQLRKTLKKDKTVLLSIKNF